MNVIRIWRKWLDGMLIYAGLKIDYITDNAFQEKILV